MSDIKIEKIKLNNSMIQKADQIIEVLNPENVDIAFVSDYEQVKPTDGVIDPLTLESCAGKFLLGMDLCMEAAIIVSAFMVASKKRLEVEESLARLERAKDYFEQLKVDKPTDKSKDAYVSIDVEVVRWNSIYDKWKILYEFFQNSGRSFEYWHNWSKKIYDKNIESISHATQMRIAHDS